MINSETTYNYSLIGSTDHSNQQIQEWIKDGFSWLEIGVFLLQRQNLKRDIAEPFIFARVPGNEVDNLIKFIKTTKGLSLTGIAPCDVDAFVDNSGSSWDLKNRYIRAYSPGIVLDGKTMSPYQTQEDAMQLVKGYFELSGWGGSHGGGIINYIGGAFKKRHNDERLLGFNYEYPSKERGVRSIEFDSSLVARTSSETRPKSIYFPYFQVVKKLDWRTLKHDKPSHIVI